MQRIDRRPRCCIAHVCVFIHARLLHTLSSTSLSTNQWFLAEPIKITLDEHKGDAGHETLPLRAINDLLVRKHPANPLPRFPFKYTYVSNRTMLTNSRSHTRYYNNKFIDISVTMHLEKKTIAKIKFIVHCVVFIMHIVLEKLG